MTGQIVRVERGPAAEDFHFAAVPPPTYQRAIDRVITSLPMRLLALLNLEPIDGDRTPLFRVVVTNRRGKSRTLAILPELEAQARCNQHQHRLAEVGVERWAREMGGQIPEAFFD